MTNKLTCEFCLFFLQQFGRPGKNRQNGKLLAGKSCDLEGKNKEIHKGNHPTLEGNLPLLEEILPSLQGNKHFFQACNLVSKSGWRTYFKERAFITNKTVWQKIFHEGKRIHNVKIEANHNVVIIVITRARDFMQLHNFAAKISFFCLKISLSAFFARPVNFKLKENVLNYFSSEYKSAVKHIFE